MRNRIDIHKISTAILLVALIVGSYFSGRMRAVVIYKDVKEVEKCDKTKEQMDMTTAKEVCPNGVAEFKYEIPDRASSTKPKIICK